MYNLFKKKALQPDNIKNKIQEYQCLKQRLYLPLKLRFFLEMLQNHAEYGSQRKKIPKQIGDIYKQFCKCFDKLPLQDKYYFMLAMVKIVQYVLQDNKVQQPKTLIQYQCRIEKIQTSCKVKQFFVGVSSWQDKMFKFLGVQKILKICSNPYNSKKQLIFQLSQYHLRASAKQKNTLVLQSVFDKCKISQKYHCYYIYLKDKTLFLQVYNNLRNAIIMTWKSRVIGMLNQPQKVRNMQFMGCQEVTVGVRMLNSQTISEYFKTKQSIVNKVLNNQIKFKLFSQIRKVRIYRSSKYHNFYKAQNTVDRPYDNVIKSIELINRQPTKKLLHYQKMENYSNTISAVYYKYRVKGCTHEMLSIVEEASKQDEFKVTFKAIDNFIVHRNVDFIEVKVQSLSAAKSKISVFGFINFQQNNKKMNPISVIDFLLSIVECQPTDQNVQLTNLRKNQSTFQPQSSKVNAQYFHQYQIQDEDDFHTVVGDNLDIEYERQLEHCNAFQSPKRQINEYEQGTDELQTEQERSVINQFRNQKGTQVRKMSKQDMQEIMLAGQGSQWDYLKHKYAIEPSEPTKDLIKQHYFSGLWAKYEKGGVFSLNIASLDKQKQIYRSILTRLGSALMKKKLSNLSIPVVVLKQESQLQSIARNMSYAPLLLENSGQKSPLQKIKAVILLMISMGTISLSLEKPFNPVLGQTFQAYLDNCPVYMEQVQHHPSVSTLYFKGRGYEVYGSIIPTISIRLNTVKCFSEAPIRVKFENEDIIQFTPSKMLVTGLLVGDRTFDFTDTTFLFDQNNKIIAQITFGPKRKFGKHLNGEKNDFLWGYIYEVTDNFMIKFLKEGRNLSPSNQKSSKIISQVYGCWQQKIFINQNVVFDFQEQLPYRMVKQKHPLRSNCTYRQDIRYLYQEKYSQAQDQKDRIQQLQRHDARLRRDLK